MNQTYLLLGSNEANRLNLLQQGLDALKQIGTIKKISSVYETEAWGLKEQPAFLNLVLLLQTEISAEELLKHIRETEAKLGRQRTVKWGQRTLDIDILFFNEDIISTDILTIPHPHLQERRFTLAPLNEIAPDFIHPVLKKSVRELLNTCPDHSQVRIFPKKLLS